MKRIEKLLKAYNLPDTPETREIVQRPRYVRIAELCCGPLTDDEEN